MDRILGSLPNIANIGESHWLTEARSPAGYGPIDFNGSDHEEIRHCSGCGAQCPIWTMDFRRDLAADGAGWYGRIARRLDTDTLVSADKNPPKLVDHDPLMRFDALVMFKSPVQAWMSTLRNLPSGLDAAFYLRECRNYVALWEDRYATLLDHFAPEGKVVFLHFDEFTRTPLKTLRATCHALHLPYDPRVLEAAGACHSIGGNSRAVAKLRVANGPIEIDALAAPDCPGEHLQALEEAASAQALFRRLLSASRETVPM